MTQQDLGLQKSFLQKVIIGDPNYKNYYALRRMFTDYLTKLNVPFFDQCCPTLSELDRFPVRFNNETDTLEYFEGNGWASVPTAGVPDPLTVGSLIITGAGSGIQSAGTGTTDIPIRGVTVQHFPGRQAYNSSPIVPVAASYNQGYFTTTSPTAMSMFLDTAANYISTFDMDIGSYIEWYIDNTQGANSITITLGTGITVATPALTGGAGLTVTVANGVAGFRMVCTGASTMKIYRIQ